MFSLQKHLKKKELVREYKKFLISQEKKKLEELAQERERPADDMQRGVKTQKFD